MHKVLLITYYWPPAGGAGVQRWLKMSKYLAKHYDIRVFCPENAQYPVQDETLAKEIPSNIQVIRQKIWEPYHLAGVFSKKNKVFQKGQLNPKKDRTLMEHLSIFVRSNFFIPDARSAWIRPASKYLLKYIEQEGINLIISTGPPHSVHLIALRLKKKHPPVKWIADFRDPWTEIDYFDKLNLTKLALNKHKKQEQDVLRNADTVVSVSPSWSASLSQIGGRPVTTIYNGFDQGDFSEQQNQSTDLLFVYSGLLNRDRSPNELWMALNELLTEDEKFAAVFKLRLMGIVDQYVKDEIRGFNSLYPCTEFIDYVPHAESIRYISEASVLLLLINNTANQRGILPGKLFEYLATGVRIFCVGPTDGDIAAILSETKSGSVIPFNDKELMKNELRKLFSLFDSNQLSGGDRAQINQFSRQSAAEQFCAIIDELLSHESN
jgi:glycosyltransferase involved in cell wall biosynthesis